MTSQNAPLITIELCMGSSCYSRGNRTLVQELNDAIDRRAWTELVQVKGCLCHNACSSGPHVQINGTHCTIKTVLAIESQIEELLKSVSKNVPGNSENDEI